VISLYADQDSESNFVESVQSLSFAGTTTVHNFGCYKIQDEIVQSEDIISSDPDYGSKVDQAILNSLQASWIETEENRNLSNTVAECGSVFHEDIDQGYPTAVLYNTDQPCQYEHDFESLYTQSVLLLHRSLAAADDLANKNTVGEWLHFTISNYISFNRAGKITGMFLAAFTVPEIIAQIHEFSSLSHLCNQALEAILESQSQE
jgi:hypothetical protein